MAPTQIAEPEFLARRRAAAAEEAVGLTLPEFKGQPGWEFTPVGSLDLGALERAPGGDADAAEHVIDLDLEVAVATGRRRGDLRGAGRDAARAGRGASPRHRRAPSRHARRGAHPRSPPRTTHTGPTARSSTSRAASTSKRRSSSRPSTSGPAASLHHRALVVLEEGARPRSGDQSLSSDPDGDGVVNGVVELIVGQNANAALRRRPGARRAHVGLRSAARDRRARRDARLDHARVRLGQRQGLPGDEARRPRARAAR